MTSSPSPPQQSATTTPSSPTNSYPTSSSQPPSPNTSTSGPQRADLGSTSTTATSPKMRNGNRTSCVTSPLSLDDKLNTNSATPAPLKTHQNLLDRLTNLEATLPTSLPTPPPQMPISHKCPQEALKTKIAPRKLSDLRFGGFPKHHLDQLSDTRPSTTLHPDVKYAFEYCFRMITEQGKTLIVLTGGHGTGKTMTACLLSLSTPSQPLYSTAARNHEDFLERQNSKNYQRCEQLYARLDKLEKSRFLVIDEISQAPRSDKYYERFNALIDSRYRNKLPTIMISNGTPETLSDHIPPITLDRIRESGCVSNYTWNSLR